MTTERWKYVVAPGDGETLETRDAHVASASSSSAPSYLKQLVEVLDVTFLHLLGGDLRLFKMDVLVVKCLGEEEER